MDASEIGHLKVSPVVKIRGYYYMWSQRNFGIKASYMVEEKHLLNSFTLQYWLSIFWALYIYSSCALQTPHKMRRFGIKQEVQK